MSTSLVAVFIPILLMGGIVGRIFREFAVTLSVAVAISMVVSLTATPMMCAKLLKSEKDRKTQWALPRQRARLRLDVLKATPAACAGHCSTSAFILGVTLGTVCLAVYLYVVVPKGFFPQQDTGRLTVTPELRGHFVSNDETEARAVRTISYRAIRRSQW